MRLLQIGKRLRQISLSACLLPRVHKPCDHPERPQVNLARSTPLLLNMHSMAARRAVLALSKMDWNKDNVHDRPTVALNCAKVLAGTVRRTDSLVTTPY